MAIRGQCRSSNVGKTGLGSLYFGQRRTSIGPMLANADQLRSSTDQIAPASVQFCQRWASAVQFGQHQATLGPVSAPGPDSVQIRGSWSSSGAALADKDQFRFNLAKRTSVLAVPRWGPRGAPLVSRSFLGGVPVSGPASARCQRHWAGFGSVLTNLGQSRFGDGNHWTGTGPVSVQP